MTAFGRGLGPAMAVLALVLATPAGAQENLDSGKTGAQLYAADCAICHKNPQTLNKSGGLFGLSGFLREHYTASKESAASIAAYLGTVGNAPAPGKRGSKRAAKGEDKDKVDAEKKPKAKSGKEKAKVDAEKKSKAKTGEDKAEKSEKSDKTREEETKRSEPKGESKSEQKSEKKTEKKSSGTKSGGPKAKESKTKDKDAKVKDAKDKDVKDKDAKASPPKEAKAKKKPGSAATAKPDKKDMPD